MKTTFKQFLFELTKVKISKDPDALGAYVTDKRSNTGNEKIVEIPINRFLETNEPKDKTAVGTASTDSEKVVQKIIDSMKLEKDIDPILVKRSGSGYLVLDGHHRLEAHKRLNRKTIKAKILTAFNAN